MAAGCGDDDGSPTPDAANPTPDAASPADAAGADAGGDAAPGGLDIARSVSIVDTETLSGADFGLRRTLQALIDSSGGAATTPEELLGSLLTTFGEDSFVNPTSNLAMPVDVRPGERDLDPAELLDPANTEFGMKAVAIYNRFERTPADGAHCGQARILYAKPASDTSGRFYLYVEAGVPNPQPELMRAGCLPVAELWASLSDMDDPADRAAALEKLFFTGLNDMEPVMKFANVAPPLGGVSSNHFINNVKWQIRAWRGSVSAETKPVFVARPVGDHPLTEFYDSTFIPTHPDVDAALFATERTNFQQNFLDVQVARLTAPEASGNPLTADSIIARFSFQLDARYFEFQSDAEGDEEDPTTWADVTFKASIATKLEGTNVTADELLTRASALTCGGCHQIAVGRRVGTDKDGNAVNWPLSAQGGFVHITETGGLSPLLTDYFLPRRGASLQTYLTENQSAVAPAAAAQAKQVYETTAACQAIRASERGLFAAVNSARERVLAASTAAERKAALAELDRVELDASACEAALPGAFDAVRLPH